MVDLAVTEPQKRFVATNAESLAEADFNPNAWFRGIYAGDTPVGFVMTEENRRKNTYYLWCFIIDQRYQRMGFGRQALRMVLDRIAAIPRRQGYHPRRVPGRRWCATLLRTVRVPLHR